MPTSASRPRCRTRFQIGTAPHVDSRHPDKDPQKAQRVMQPMMQMKKIDIAALKRACDSR